MAPKTFKFGVIVEGHKAEMHEAELRPIESNEILIKNEACQICTTDYQQWQGLRDHQGFPMAGGHEFAGRIVEKGADVIDDFQIGDLVGVNLYPSCGICDNCRQGHTSDCTGIKKSGAGADGYYGSKGFSNYFIADQKTVLKMNNNLSAAEAGFLEPVATVVQCVKQKAKVQPMEDVVVIGAGTMGLLNAQVAKAMGARVIITDISEKKIETAKKMGNFDVINSKEVDPVQAVKDLTGGKGADCVISGVGSTIAYKQGYDMLKPLRGRLVIFPAGYPKPELNVDPNELHYRKMDIIGSFGADNVDFLDAATLISKGLIDVNFSMEGKTIGLKDINKAYEAAATPDSYRVTVDLQDVE